jgi:hypothetical protein
MSITIKKLKAIARLGKADFFEFSTYLFQQATEKVEEAELSDITLKGPGFTANLNISTPDYSIDLFDQGLGYTLFYNRETKTLTSVKKVTDLSEIDGILRCSEGVFTLCPYNNYCKSHTTESCRQDALNFAGLLTEEDQA